MPLMRKHKSTKTKETKPQAQSIAASMGFPEGILPPSTVELATLAAALAPRDRSPDNKTWPQFAIRSALHLYLEAAKFCHDHRNDSFASFLAACRHPSATDVDMREFIEKSTPPGKPDPFPLHIPFEKFLNCLMPEVHDVGRQYHRFRELAGTVKTLPEASEEERKNAGSEVIQTLSQAGVSEWDFDYWAVELKKWWREKNFETKSNAGRAGATARAKKKTKAKPKVKGGTN